MPPPSPIAATSAEPAGPPVLDVTALRAGLTRCGRIVARHQRELTRLDAVLGDGDHGDNLAIGFRAVDDLLADLPDDTPPGELLRAVGHRLVAAVGGASGPLYGTACIEAGFRAGEARLLDAHLVSEMLTAAADGLARRGRCRVGDKTILDALAPAAEAFAAALADGATPASAYGQAVRAAVHGMHGSRDLVARRGLAIRLGERSVGHRGSRRGLLRAAALRAGGSMTDRAALLARIEALERESRRAFDDAQREADALFAQYQLSQLVASGGTLSDLARSVALEAVRLAAVDGGALWLSVPDDPALHRVASVGTDAPADVPAVLDGLDDGQVWAAGLRGGRAVVVSDEPPVILLCLWTADGRAPDADGVRVIQLARHELAVAFQGARLREVLERERQELTAVVNGTTDLILQVDAERRVVRLNPAGERLLGITAMDALGRSCGEVLGCDVAGGHDVAACPLAEVMAGGQPIAYRETAVRGPDGSSIRVAGGYSTVALHSTDVGDPQARARATAVVRDISAVRALEELREGFVATVSHELRTPLSLIRGYTETLLHLDLSLEEQRDYLVRIDEVTGRLSALVGQILDVTHLQADPLILERAPVLFVSLVSRLRGDLETSGRAERLVVDLPDDLPPLDVDGPRVGQILENLVGNAFKYGPPDGLVTIRASAAGDWLTVTVDDEGVGIPVAERPLVTEPFHRAWNVRESRIPGTGLGLFISRRLVEAHGGRLRLDDRADGTAGTRVTFTLPLLRGRRTPPGRRVVAEAATGSPAPGPRRG